MGNYNALQAALWSIAIPGFGQLVNGKYLKGLTLIGLEFLINMKSNLNTIIISSFHGQTIEAINSTNYQWLMFYPCIYLFAIWDACYDAGGKEIPLLFLPFTLSAYTGTIGCIYSNTFTINNIFPGPLWMLLGSALIGFGLGILIRYMVLLNDVNYKSLT
ncbi:MAG: hypothetical protein PHC92_08270 [Syntrophomonadaceae bacterium]|nr:hypothetical protein [Syntrophomonadaceae bacterium]